MYVKTKIISPLFVDKFDVRVLKSRRVESVSVLLSLSGPGDPPERRVPRTSFYVYKRVRPLSPQSL